jgi:hypothetical protein
VRLDDPDGTHRDEQDDTCYNSAATHLMRDVASTKTRTQSDTRHMPYFLRCNTAYRRTYGFGSSPDYWGPNTKGAVCAARADGLPLPAQHLEAICSYISEQVEPRLSSCILGLGPGAIVPQREWVLNSISKADFMEFYDELKASRGATDLTWRFLPSPYELTPGIVDGMRPLMEGIWEAQKAHGILQQSEISNQSSDYASTMAQLFSNLDT